MRHFVQYHKSEDMRRSCAEIDALRIVTSKPVDGLCGNTVWLLCGEGRPRAYYLCCRFVVDEVGADGVDEFSNYASGSAGVFLRPPIRLDQEPWFRAFLARIGNGAFGLQSLREEDVARLSTLIASRGGE